MLSAVGTRDELIPVADKLVVALEQIIMLFDKHCLLAPFALTVITMPNTSIHGSVTVGHLPLIGPERGYRPYICTASRPAYLSPAS